MKIDIEERDGACRLSLAGELDMAGAPEVERHLGRMGSDRASLFVLDLRGLAFIDSTGLRLVVRADEQARASGSRFVIVRGPEEVQRVFEVVGLDARLEFVDEPPAPSDQ